MMHRFEIELSINTPVKRWARKVPMGWEVRAHATIDGVSMVTLECGAADCRAAVDHALTQLDAADLPDPVEIIITRRPKAARLQSQSKAS